MAKHLTVNQANAGSNPAPGANDWFCIDVPREEIKEPDIYDEWAERYITDNPYMFPSYPINYDLHDFSVSTDIARAESDYFNSRPPISTVGEENSMPGLLGRIYFLFWEDRVEWRKQFRLWPHDHPSPE